MAPAGDEPEHDGRAGPRLADSDGELLCRIAERDLDAFDILYLRYARPVYGLALRRLSDPGRAEDAALQAFVAIWRSARTYVPEPGGAARWLFTVAWTAIEPGPGAVDEDGWPIFRVHAAVAELPETERLPLELAYWEGRSRGEIADLLGLSVGVVEAHTRSALARLAVRLGDADEQTDA